MTNDKPILYAEDDEDDVFLMKRAFKKAGVVNPLQIVTDGNLAIKYLSGLGRYANREAHPLPCLILLDLKMPGKSGFEVLKWLRMQPSLSTLPVIVITSSNHESDIHRAYLIGANGFLIKPGKPDELLAKVQCIKDYWLTHNRMPPAYPAFSDEIESGATKSPAA